MGRSVEEDSECGRKSNYKFTIKAEANIALSYYLLLYLVNKRQLALIILNVMEVLYLINITLCMTT